jgi:hypothetical protein
MNLRERKDQAVITLADMYSELYRLQAIEKAVQEYSGGNTYDELIDWLESVTDWRQKQ